MVGPYLRVLSCTGASLQQKTGDSERDRPARMHPVLHSNMNAIDSAQPSMISAARLMAFALLLMTFMVPCAATEARLRQVLMLQSFDRGNLILDHFTANFRVDLAQDAAGPLNIVQITVGPTGSVAASDSAVVDFSRASYANRSEPDLIVSVAAPAAVFARK